MEHHRVYPLALPTRSRIPAWTWRVTFPLLPSSARRWSAVAVLPLHHGVLSLHRAAVVVVVVVVVVVAFPLAWPNRCNPAVARCLHHHHDDSCSDSWTGRPSSCSNSCSNSNSRNHSVVPTRPTRPPIANRGVWQRPILPWHLDAQKEYLIRQRHRRQHHRVRGSGSIVEVSSACLEFVWKKTAKTR